MRPIIIPLSMSQAYLLPCRDGYLQIDSGYDRDYPVYRRGMARKGIPLQYVKYLLLTHHHDDQHSDQQGGHASEHGPGRPGRHLNAAQAILAQSAFSRLCCA